MDQKITPEQQQDINSRVDEFKKEYLALVEKFQVDFVAYPQYVQVQGGGFVTLANMQILDKKYLPTPSPIQNVIKES